MSEFDKLKDEAEKEMKEHPEQVKEGQQARDVRGFATNFYTREGNWTWSGTTSRCSSSRTRSSSRM